jgi:hypothetical protein
LSLQAEIVFAGHRAIKKCFSVSGHRAPHFAAIGPAHVLDVRIAVTLAAPCGTLWPLVPWFSLFRDLPRDRLCFSGWYPAMAIRALSPCQFLQKACDSVNIFLRVM